MCHPENSLYLYLFSDAKVKRNVGTDKQNLRTPRFLQRTGSLAGFALAQVDDRYSLGFSHVMFRRQYQYQAIDGWSSCSLEAPW